MMLLTGYRKEIFRPKCNPSFQSVHCIAHLDDDVGAVLPYLNAALGGHEYIDEPRSVTLRVHGKLITVHARQIAINALKDESEADKILAWLQQEINDAWNSRSKIEPRYEGLPKPRMMEILKLLPRTNCGECGTSTCTVFAVAVCEGVKDPADCPPLTRERAAAIEEYLNGFDMKSFGWD